jgi:hypothetical protein
MVMVMLKTCQQSSKSFLFSILSSKHPFVMSLLTSLNEELVNYAKSMPERNIVEDLDFKVWGKGFCKKMVSFVLRFCRFTPLTLVA